MKTLLQRVLSAKVDVNGTTVGAINRGLLVFVGIEHDDNESTLQRMCDKILAYRMFADDHGKMNRNVVDIGGGVLLVSQFTLAAETNKGLRPSFSTAAPPAAAQAKYNDLLIRMRKQHDPVEAGCFGADMKVSLINDGPVTFLLTM